MSWTITPRFTPPPIIDSNLYLNLDAGNPSSYGGSGTTWSDVSGNGYNTTLVGPTFDSANGGAFVFDGLDDYANVPAPNPGSLPITFEFWINSTLANPTGIYDSAPVAANVLRQIGGNLEWHASSPNVSLGLTANTWYQIVAVYRFNATRFIDYYRNGILVSSTAGSASSSFAWTNFKLGGINRPTYNDASYSGKLAKFAIYTKALSASEVFQNFSSLRYRFGL
jgi:hypothetical protein